MHAFYNISIKHNQFLWPRQESNLDLGLRRPLYYPLYYEAGYVVKR